MKWTIVNRADIRLPSACVVSDDTVTKISIAGCMRVASGTGGGGAGIEVPPDAHAETEGAEY
jgi:hypothetical protein